MATNIRYVKGDATSPAAKGNKIIVHICNDIGAWGKGFVLALSAKWKEPEKQYREWFRSEIHLALGQVQFVRVADDIWVANLIGQRDIRKNQQGLPPIRYEAVGEGLKKVGAFAKEIQASVHMPKIGCGLAGGRWAKMEPLVAENIAERGVEVTVYELS